MKLTIQIKARPEKAQEFHQTLHALIPEIRSEKGCRACHVCRDLEDCNVFILEADWYARSSIERFFQSSRAGALLGAIDLLSESATARVGNNVLSGMEFLKRMRKQKKKIGRTKADISPVLSDRKKSISNRKERKKW